MKNTLKWLLSSGCILAVVGCANFNSIHRKTGIYARGQTEFVDAKQRAVLVNPVYTTRNIIDPITGIVKTKVDLDYRICSEPSPDVFSAYATSAAAKAAASNTGKDKSASGAFGMSSAEAAATIERTQVINMLRESMFRTCERWMNGALSERQMNIQTARDQRMMVATLAIEQLTGVVKRKPTILTSHAVSALGENTNEMIEALTKAQNETKEAQTKSNAANATKTEAEKAYDTANKPPTTIPDGMKGCDIVTADGAGDRAKEIAEENGVDIAECKKQNDARKVPATQAAAKTAYDLANKKIAKLPDGLRGSCKIVTDEKAEKIEITLVGDSPTKEQCKKLSDDKKKAGDEASTSSELLEKKKKNEERITKLVEGAANAYAAATTYGSGGADNDLGSTERMEAVVKTVERITDAAFSDQSEIVFSCIQDLSKNIGNAEYKTACIDMIKIQFAINASKGFCNDCSDKSSALLTALAGLGIEDAKALKMIDKEERIQDAIEAKMSRVITCLSDPDVNKKLSPALLARIAGNSFPSLPLKNKKDEISTTNLLKDGQSLGIEIRRQCGIK